MEEDNDLEYSYSERLKQKGFAFNINEYYWTSPDNYEGPGTSSVSEDALEAIWFLSGDIPFIGLDG
jgi:hypothetical protein